IRTASDPAAFRKRLVAILGAVDPDAAVSDMGTMRQFLDASLGPRRFSLGLVGVFALTTVILAVLGLYGLVSYGVSQRTSEIGLRMALGATGGDVRRMILRQAAGLAAVGTLAGFGIAGVVAPVIRHAIPASGVLSIRPGGAAAAAALLAGIVLMAAWLP